MKNDDKEMIVLDKMRVSDLYLIKVSNGKETYELLITKEQWEKQIKGKKVKLKKGVRK